MNFHFVHTLKTLYQKFILPDIEKSQLLKLIQDNIKKNESILDVGCGNGRYLIPLKEKGYIIEGIDKNVEIIKKNKIKGFVCYTPDEFKLTQKKYKLIILSHIIEHFSPEELLKFLNYYLSRLEIKGFLIIATPLHSPYFYDDFDHVKPYHPLGIDMVFGENNAQIQYQSIYKLNLKFLWYRKTPRLLMNQNRKHLKSFISIRWYQFYDFVAALLYYLSFKLISRKDGWLGFYVKNQ